MTDHPFQIVMVQWLDSMGCAAWQHMKIKTPTPPLKVTTIGWVIHEEASYIEIAQSIAPTPDGDTDINNTISIPKVAILSQMIVPPMKFGD